MAYLFDRGDSNSANRLRIELSSIVKMAFGGEADTIWEYLTRLSSGEELSCDDPAFSFPWRRCATEGSVEVRVEVTAHLDPEVGNRELQFRVHIEDNWILDSTLQAEAAREAESWIFLKPPSGYCSNRALAMPGLTSLVAKQLNFQRCS